MAGIFLSYRRGPGTSETVGRLYDRLAVRFGKDMVFMDVDTVRPGMDFVEAISREIGSSQAVLAIIDPNWATDTTGRDRISEHGDYVRLEVASALRQGVTVIPVLVLGAQMPSSSALPPDLRPLTRRHAIVLAHERFNTDVLPLEQELEILVGGRRPAMQALSDPEEVKSAPGLAGRQRIPHRKRKRRAVLLLVVAVVVAGVAFMVRPWENGPDGGELILEAWEHRPDEAIVVVWGRNVGDDSAASPVVCEFELPTGERWPEEVGSVYADAKAQFEQPLGVGPGLGVTDCWFP